MTITGRRARQLDRDLFAEQLRLAWFERHCELNGSKEVVMVYMGMFGQPTTTFGERVS